MRESRERARKVRKSRFPAEHVTPRPPMAWDRLFRRHGNHVTLALRVGCPGALREGGRNKSGLCQLGIVFSSYWLRMHVIVYATWR
ncbi:hypothetical protein CEXT_690331 [Caerostris extrusa]|uniref:Uncharacterized protein n=1 Tax=Caerostris extrusa TaxID=172846 RepID=A0AAV4S6M6_CAEEX|nr:hypothetical protein CEXT_690331 [Caerostris extrusa]